MNPVPQDRYSPCREVVMTIQFNMHISVDGTYYSVPYTAYLKQKKKRRGRYAATAAQRTAAVS